MFYDDVDKWRQDVAYLTNEKKDFLVNSYNELKEKVVIEIKSVDSLNDLHLAQTLTYLRLGGFRLGLLLNFNSVVLRSGIKRLVNNL